MGTDAAFATLGIAVGAQPIEITRAFRAQSRHAHPDAGGEPAAFATIVAAYRTLQRAGLVRSERSATPVRNPSAADLHYRRFVAGLDRVVAMPETRVEKSPERRSVVDTRETSMTFAEILDRELLRVG